MSGIEPRPGRDWTRGIDGNWYPPPQPRPRPSTARPAPAAQAQRASVAGLVGVLLALTIVGAAIAGIVVVIRSNEKVDVLNATSQHSFGDTIRSGDVDVRVNAARLHFTPAVGADAPPPGHYLVVVDITVRNAGLSDSVAVTAAELLDLVDAAGSPATPTAITELVGVDGALDGDDSRRGFVVFLVADAAATPLNLRVKGTLTGEPATFRLS